MSVLYLKNNQGIWEEVSTINGHTPVITASKSNGITTIYADGTTVATINDGEKGEKGEDGETPLSAFPNDTASGQIVHITDGADDIPMDSVKVKIEPVQNLNGQSNPYPAGGGKNLFDGYTAPWKKWQLNSNVFRTRPDTDPGITFTPNEDGTVTVITTGTYMGVAVEIESSDADRVFSVSGASSVALYSAYEDGASRLNVSPTYATISAGVSGYIGIRFDAVGTYTIKCQLESGSTATDYAPYSNICPITGFIEANVVRIGKNLFDPNQNFTLMACYDKNGEIVYRKGAELHLSDGTYAFSASKINTDVGYIYLNVLNADGSFVRFWYFIASSDIRSFVTTLEDGQYIIIYDSLAKAESDETHFHEFNIQIENGSTTTEYEPYQGNTYPITFPSETGTVYGGELDVTNGTLTVDRAMVTFDGSESWNIQSINSYGIANFYTSVDHYPAANFRSLCNMLPPQTSLIGETKTEGYFVHQNGATIYIRIFSSRASTVAELMTWLASNPIQLVYELAEPITYTLTPTEIKSLYGENNIYADCGSTSVTYRADTTSYIGKIITATKSGTVTTVYVKDKPIATINDGTNGKDYTLTTQDKADIAQQVINILPTAQGVSF